MPCLLSSTHLIGTQAADAVEDGEEHKAIDEHRKIKHREHTQPHQFTALTLLVQRLLMPLKMERNTKLMTSMEPNILSMPQPH